MKTILSTKWFTYNKVSKEFVAEISELPIERVEDFTLTSHITGKESDWVMQSVQFDPDGDILFWTLRPATNTLATHPGLAGASITILND